MCADDEGKENKILISYNNIHFIIIIFFIIIIIVLRTTTCVGSHDLLLPNAELLLIPKEQRGNPTTSLHRCLPLENTGLS